MQTNLNLKMTKSNFNLQPEILEDEITKLIPLQENDFDALYKVASDPLIWEQHPIKDRYKIEVFKPFFDAAINSKGAFLILDKKTNEIIGTTRFYDYNAEEIQYCNWLYFYWTKILGRFV